MAEPLKNSLNKKYVTGLGHSVLQTYPEFPLHQFVASTVDSDWKNRELKQRMSHICDQLEKHLPADYQQAIAILLNVAPAFGSYEALFFPEFVSSFGMAKKNRKTSLYALETLTQYSSSEFAVRPFIMESPLAMMKWMLKKSTDKNYHVRRLASEGCRPRLPWAPALPMFKDNPELIFPILENLKSDPELYVRKSVANNINDICKDNPKPMLKILRRWKKERPTQETQWIINHGLRTLIKEGCPQALSLIGFRPSPPIGVGKIKLSSRKVTLGTPFSFSLVLENSSNRRQPLLLDYIVYHQKQNGSQSPKVFKWKRLDLEAGEKITLQKTHKFQKINTRKYHSGEHSIQVQINGKKYPLERFRLHVMD